jgi:broad specificity phosphatase PhoE
MRRARETAAPLATRLGASPAIEPRVSEVIAPPGTPDRRAWLRANFPWEDPKALRQWSSLDPGVRLWRAAMLEAVHAIRSDTAIFTHFIAINAIASAAMGLEHTIVCTPNYASITAVETRDGRLHFISLDAGTGVGDVR